MKLKQFIFALVAMLSFAFSAFAQSTVSNEADLRTALNGGGEVTLGASITVSAPVTIPSGSVVVLNLNGKTLKAANAKTKVLENSGKLTINGQGTVSGIIYNGTANGSTAEMTLNGGTYSLDGNNGGLHHYGKTLTINDGVVVKTTSYGVRMAGKGSVLNLNGGTYTSTGTGDMARPLALSNGTVNFLDSDITVNGHMHVMVGQVTVNFGENNQYSPFEAYHQGNDYASSVFYCTTLAEALKRTDYAPVTLVKNVKVADGAPLTVNKEIKLNLNGKNISATNAKTTVLKNYANLTINGKGTVTGLVYNGDADNKGVAEMTLNGGTYKLDGANGGFFNYGKTLTVNDGVTISSQVYGLRMSNAASVIELNGGTFTSTNPTDNMKRAIAVDAGTINFNDDDITINGYFHANRSNAKVNFGEYCPFDAFMYSTTNASGYYVVNLENAIAHAEPGYEIVLQKNLERSEIVTLPKKLTLDGNGKTLTSAAGRAINVDCADVVTIENLTIAGATGCERGINIINKAGTTNIKKVNVSGVSHYAVHVATSAGAAQVNIENSNLTGWAAVAAYGEGGTVNVKNSNLVGINNYTGNSDDFATVAAGSNIAINVTGGNITAESFEGKAAQAIVCAQSSVENAKFTLDAELELKGTAEYVNIDLDKNTVTVREAYGANFVTTPAGNGLVTLTGASEAMIGNVKYSTIAQAFAAAKEGETITLIADVTPSLTSQRAITKAAVIDLNGKTMTLTEDDLYFGTTKFNNGTIVVDPSVKPSTAVFWMFKDQVLTFEGVKLVATGVTGTYLIGLDGDNADLNLFSSEIIVDNETALDLDIICVNASTGNDIWMEDSKVTVKNLDGRVFFRGNYTVAGESEINLEGITKAGFRIEAGQTLTIKDRAVVNVTGEPRDGGIHLTDPSANYTKAETATVNATINQPQVAKVGETIYKSLIAAVEAVEDGGTITLVANETFTKTNRTHNSGTWYDGLYYVGDKSFTIDLGGFTISQDGAVNDYLLNFKNSGSKANTITLKNGTIDAGTAAFCAICTSSSQAKELTINTENINIINNISNGSTIKLRGGAVLNVKDGTKITGKNSYLGIECVASTVNIYKGAEIYMNGTTSYNGCLVGACGGGTVNVYGGYGKGAKGGFIAMTSGGTINVAGGEWIANTDGTVGNNSNVYVLTAQSNKNESGFVGASIINVTGGTFRGGMDAWVLNNHKDEKAELNISGGNFNANPTKYVEDDYIAVENNGVWNVVKAAAKIGEQGYATLQAAVNAVKNGETITLILDIEENVTLTEKVGLYYTIDGNGKTMNGTITVKALSDTEDNRRITIKGINFVADAKCDFITSTETNHYPRLTVESCSFTGTGKEAADCVAIRLKSSHSVVIKDCTGTGLHSFLQNTSGWNLTIENVTVTDSKSGLALGTVQGVTIKGCDLAVEGYGVRLDAGYNNKAVIEDNTIEAFIPVVVRKATVDSNITVKGENDFTASNTDGLWCAIGTSEYETNGTMPTAAAGKVKVVVNSDLPQNGLYGNHVEGSLSAAYAGADGYWGECGGNANYSFELKFFNGETYMGSTSLNDKDNIIDGDVYVTWNMLLNAESNTDEYWTMAWTVAPSVAMQPNRVEQWVDGVKVAECAIQLNGPDNLKPIATAVVDADGNLVKCYPTLEAAVAAGNNVAILKAGTYKVPTGKDLTITGAVDGVEFANIGAHNMGSANVTFNNVTFTYASNSMYKGLQHSGNLVYNNCTFNGQVFLYGQSETFNNCTFNTTDAANYNVWTYGAKEVAFNECTFNSAGKSVLIYSDQASVTNNVTVTKSQFKASQAVEGKAAIEMDSSISGAISLTIDGETTATGFGTGNVSVNSLWNNKKGNADDANNDITVVVAGETVLAPVFDAQIGDAQYRTLQDAVDAVKNNETITLLNDIAENVTVVQAPDMAFTIDGNGKTMKGTITVNGKSAAYATAGLTIKKVNFVADGIATEACINLGVKGDNNTRYTNGVTVDNCTFTGTNKVKVAVKNYTGGCKNVTISNCTATGLHSLAQFKTSTGITLTKNTVTECKNGISVEGSTGVTVTECTVVVDGYGIRANGGSDVTVTSSNVEAFTPVVVRNVTANSNFAFNGENTMTANDETGKWMVIGDEEYEAGKVLPAESTANVVVALNDANLSYTGIHGAGLAGKGTEDEPYLINNVAELQMFRDKVNAGATKFNAPGVWVALGADIDLTGINWVGIGSMTAEHGFMGNFDGKSFKIQNLTIDNPAVDADGYAYAGFFALTEGTDKDNQNVVKNLTIENVTINTTGDIVSAAIAYAYYTNVNNVKVCGNIAIKGGDYTAGVLAYTRRCVNASNLSIDGNDGSYVKGTQIVGGVISDIQMNGGLTAVYSNFSAEGITVAGEKSVGGIAGIIATQTLNGAAVKNVILNSTDEFAGVVAGRLGGTSTISNVVSENVTGATAVIGATYDGAKAVEARIGDTYYATFAAAYEAAQAGETVTMLVDLTIAESLAIDKSIAIDGNGRTLTYTGSGQSARAITVENTAEGVELAISNLTVDCTSSWCQRGINYNTNGKLTLDNVTVKGTKVSYALNLPGSSDNAQVTIKNSSLTGLIALNVWGENSTVNVENTTLTAVDNATNEGYAAVKLNNDGETAAEGTVINITGGKIDVTGTACQDTEAVSNATSTGEINISNTTDVNGEVTTIVAVIRYNNGYSYSFQTIEEAIAKAEADNTVTLLRDITVAQPVAINKAITLDGNNKAINYTGSNRAIEVANIADADIDVTIKNLTINNTASYTERGINYNENGTLTLENVTVNGEHTTYAINLPGMSQNANVVIKDSKFTGLIALNIWGANTQVTAENSEFYSVDHSTAEGYAAIKLNNNGTTAANNSTVVINGGKVIAMDNNGAASIAVEDCTSGSTVTISDSTEVIGSTTKSVAIISYGSQFYTFSTIEEAIAVAKAGETIELISDVTISYGARKLLATAATDKAVTIDGKGHTLTLNSTDSDWSSIGLADNNKLVLKNMTVNKAGKGATSGAWNTHAIIFSTAVEMENVTVNNAVAVAADAAFTNVAFNEANGYYSLWIEANGQTVTVKGGSMTATNGGRGIKVADQYINNPAKVTLKVDGTVFNTAKKAAVLVSSTAGADITAANVNIENVAEDIVNFVWVDEDWATYFGNVTVNGALVVMENADSFAAAVSVDGAVKAYYKSVADALAAAQAGNTVTILAGEYTQNLNVNKAITVKGEVDAEGNNLVTFNGKLNITADGATVKNINVNNGGNSAGYVGAKDVTVDGCQVVGGNGFRSCYTSGTVTFKNSVITGATYGIHFDGNAGGNIVIENCTITGWTSFAGTIENVAISGTTFAEGNYNQLRLYQNATFTGCTFNEKMNIDWGSSNKTAEFDNCSVNGDKELTEIISLANIATKGIEVTIDKVSVSVAAKVDGKYYLTLQAAIDAATEGQKVTILSDIALTEGVTVAADKNIFIDLNGNTVSMKDATAATAALIKNNGTLTIESSVDGGKLSFETTTPSAANSYASNTISNYGTLTINSGIVENLSTGGACYALDNYAGSAATINGGKLTAEKTAVRVFNWTNGEANAAELNVDGGEIISNDGYGININAGNAPYVALNVSGGTITTNDTDYNLAVYVVNKNSAENFTANISGGTFNGNLALNGVTSTTMAKGNVAVTGGTFDGVICYGEPACQFITGGSYKTEITEDYLVYGYQLEANTETALYDVNWTGRREVVTIVDGEVTEFDNENDIEVGTLTYKRKFAAVNVWQPLYVPFEIPVSKLIELGYDVAYTNDVHLDDNEFDGIIDRIWVEYIGLKVGNLKANFPYVVRAKNTAALDLTLVFNEAMLRSTSDDNQTVLECSSAFYEFEFGGTYNTVNRNDLRESEKTSCFALVVSSGNWAEFINDALTLNPFRVYMTMTAKPGSPYIIPEGIKSSIGARVVGEELPDGTTVIYDVYDENTEDMIFDLQGRRVLETEKGGIYIKGGKKFIAQ